MIESAVVESYYIKFKKRSTEYYDNGFYAYQSRGWFIKKDDTWSVNNIDSNANPPFFPSGNSAIFVVSNPCICTSFKTEDLDNILYRGILLF